MNRKVGKLRSMLIVVAGTVMLAGCGVNTPNNTQGGGTVSPSPTNAATETPAPTESPTATPELLEQEVTVFLSDEQLIDLIERKVTVQYGNELDLVKATLAALQQNDEPNISLWNPIAINEVVLEGGVLTLDISIPDEARLGAPGEGMLVDSLRQSLFQFPFIDSIQLLLEGEQAESLMGHVELQHPMTREQ